MSKKEEAYKRLRDAISFGDLRPGERLVEKTICESFKLGRTPLREAFALLQMEGFIEVFNNRGAVVKSITIREVEELYDIIAVLEGFATKKAAENITLRHKKELMRIHGALGTFLIVKDYRSWLERNVMFHEYLHNICGNENLRNLISSFRKRVFRYRLMNMMIGDVFEGYMKDHESIIKAIENGKPREAGVAMLKHGFRVKKNLARFLQENPTL